MIKKLSGKLESNKFTGFFLNRQIFSIIYIIICVVWFFPLCGSYINIISKVCFCWGAALIAYDLFTKRQLFKSYKAVFLVLMVGSYVITTLLNHQDMLYMGVKHIVYNGIFLFILYAQDDNKNEDVYKKYLRRMNNIIISIALLASIISFVMYVMNLSFVIQGGEQSFRQGFLENRLFGIYTSPNTGALMAIVSVLLCLMNYFLYEKKPGKLKILYIINTVMQTIYYSLTLSKGGFVTLLIMVVLLIVIFVLPILQKRFKPFISLSLCALVIILSVLVVHYVPTLLRAGLSYVPSYVQSLTETPEEKENKTEEKIEFVRIESGDDASNGRTNIWKAGFTALKEYPLFGLADMRVFQGEDINYEDFHANIISSKVDINVLSDDNISNLIRANGNMHNAYVQIIVYSGIIGFLLFISFAVLLVKKYVLTLLKMDKDSYHYKIIGVIFTLVGALAANGMIENHLLFDRQDPYGAVFWFYLGIGIYFINSYYKQQMEKNKKLAFVCDTPIQVMNAMNFVSNDIQNSKNKSDIYIYHQFKNSHEICDNLKKIKYFQNVFDVEIISTEKHWYTSLATLKRLKLPDGFLRKNMKPYSKTNEYNYKYLVLCAYNSFAITMKSKFNKAQVLTLEEGVASYIGNNMKDENSKLLQLADKLLFNGLLTVNSKALYVNNLSLCESAISENKYELPHIESKNLIADLKMVFNYKENDIYRKHRIVLLTQPFNENEKVFCDFNINIKNSINESGYINDCIVRIHPRQFDDFYKDLTTDKLNNLWELEVLFQINDDSILISSLSTAQIMPLMLTNKQPHLIFFYKLDPLFVDDDYVFKNAESFVNNIKKSYSNPNKVHIVEKFEDLSDILTEILNA